MKAASQRRDAPQVSRAALQRGVGKSLLRLLRRRQVRPVRGALFAFRHVDTTARMAVALQWVAAIFLAYSLTRYRLIMNPGARALLLVAASVSGPLTLFGLMRAAHRMRSHRFQHQHLLHCSQHDELTGLPNRAAMRSHFAETIAEARTDQASLTCFYLDLDGLRHANTLLGFRVGDELLQKTVERISGCLAPSDQFSRFGGDKFTIVLKRDLSRLETDALAECILHTVSRPHVLNGRNFSTGLSIGIAEFPADGNDDEAVLAAAERAMYTIKRAGQNSYHYAEHEEDPATLRQKLLAEKLQRALHSDGLKLVYQPIFAQDGTIVAAEALARWHDADEGNISPVEFIPVAESTGLIVPLSKWVLRRACEQMRAWRATGTTLRRVAVNICVLQVSRNDFVSTVEHTLRETGLPPECLELEVTESALARDFASVKEHLQALRQLGIRISIDDFGTGYSSFGRLRELEADALKIDRVFVQGAQEEHNGIAVIQAIVDMAHALRLGVVAEGVETKEQLQMLRDLNCDELQGFLLARPQAPEDLIELLATRAVTKDPGVLDQLFLMPHLA